MHQKRLYIAVFVIVLLVGGLVYTALNSTAKEVTTVDELAKRSSPRTAIRVAGRVTDAAIEYRTSPDFLLGFTIQDIQQPNETIRVQYRGIMPDTLRAGRDVIIEGDFSQGIFTAKTLLTQCPSKYEVPLPGREKSGGEKYRANQQDADRTNLNDSLTNSGTNQ